MIDLIPLIDKYSIYQLSTKQEIPEEIISSEFYSITKTEDEISIVTNYNFDFKQIKSSKNWKGFKVDGTMDFSLVGIINDITKPLKDNGISVFVLSTYNTDYLFVKEENFDKTIEIFNYSENIRIKK